MDRRQISATAAPLAPSVSPLEDAEERKRLAEEYGFTQIGEPVPEGVTLKNVIDTFPPEVSDDNISELLCKDFVGLYRIGCYEIAYVVQLHVVGHGEVQIVPLVRLWVNFVHGMV